MWEEKSIEEAKVYYGKLGNTCFWISRNGKEWKIAPESIQELPDTIDITMVEDYPEGMKWNSYIANGHPILSFLPALPDRPVVIKPKNTFQLLPGMNTQLYFHIPVWIQFYSGSITKENLITELPSSQLSSTWFGDSDNGVLSYSLQSELNTQLKQTGQLHNETLCAVTIINNSSTILNIQRLLLNVEFLSIYCENDHLFTSEIKLSFKGENAISDVHYSPHAPSFLEGSRLLTTPRNPERKNVLRKSFHFVKSLTEY